MTLLGAQLEFAYHFGRLLLHASELGYAVSIGDVQRSVPEQKRLIALGLSWVRDPVRALHVLKLAGDINLFRSHHYLTTVADYQPLGSWWEQQFEGASWGGHFNDARHFSLRWGGVRATGAGLEERC